MGLPHAGSYSFQSEKKEWSQDDSSAGLKKIVYALTQSGTDAPVATLLQNDSSLDLSGVTFERKSVGRYGVEFPTTDETLFDRFFPETNNRLGGLDANATVSMDNSISKFGSIDCTINTYTSGSVLSDGAFLSTLFTIYINE